MRVLYASSVGFPIAFTAAAQKQRLISKALIEGGCDVTIVNKKSSNRQSELKYKGVSDGIKYRYTTFSVSKSKNSILKIARKLLGIVSEFLFLLFKPKSIILTNNRSFFTILNYYIISRLNGSKLVVTIVEDSEMVPLSNSKLGLIDAKMYKKNIHKLADGILPISNYLMESIKIANPKIPQLKVPVLVDLEGIEKIEPLPSTEEEPYFLFCGSAFYYEIIEFIINTYRLNILQSKLIIIANGTIAQTKKIEKFITDFKLEKKVKLLQNLNYDKLIGYYKSAIALLIPLRDSIQDKSRFPHKIGEYCASKNVIITTNIGEIPNYFSHKENALLMDSYCKNELANLMQEIESQPEIKQKLAENAFNIAKTEFDYKIYSEKLVEFFKILKNDKANI